MQVVVEVAYQPEALAAPRHKAEASLKRKPFLLRESEDLLVGMVVATWYQEFALPGLNDHL